MSEYRMTETDEAVLAKAKEYADGKAAEVIKRFSEYARHTDEDVSVGGDVAVGGDMMLQGGALIRGDVKVEGWLEAHNVRMPCKGFFTSEDNLKETYPRPHDGWWAIADEALPGKIYAAWHGEWKDTGQTGILESVALQEATQRANDAASRADIRRGEIEAMEAERQSNEQAREEAVAGAVADAVTALESANEAVAAADKAKATALERLFEMNAALARMEELERTITAKDRRQPTGMTVDYPEMITKGNTDADFLRIRATLFPAGTGGNVLFLGDDKAVSVAPGGTLTVNEVGTSVIHVIPTENTSIYRTIRITVTDPSLRLVEARPFRIDSENKLRFT